MSYKSFHQPRKQGSSPSSAISTPGLLSNLVQNLRGQQNGLFIPHCVGTWKGYDTSVQIRIKYLFLWVN